MVYFKDISSFPGSQELVILDDEDQSVDRGTCLAIRTPMMGRYVRSWPTLVNSLYKKEWTREVSLGKTLKAWILLAAHHRCSDESIHHQRSGLIDQDCYQSSREDFLPTLGRRIIEGKAKWGDALQFAGEFQYVKGYWEWTEDVLSRCKQRLDAAQIYNSLYASLFTYDRNAEVMKAFFEAWCSSTNTLLTSFGELSISLWDLHLLAGLPLTGSLYDEVVPSLKELNGVDRLNSRFVPCPCRYLFQAYHLLRKNAAGGQSSKVSIEMWITFWSRKDMKYRQPPQRKEKKKNRSKSTHNPSGDFDVHQEWAATEEAPFLELGLDKKWREETYLAAYLACWLCAFVLPVDEISLIRPTTFKMASMMATGQKVSLAVPVLASIYKGLNRVSNSPRPSRVDYPFPVHFVSGWLACYFKTHYPTPQHIRGSKMTQFSGEGGAKYFDSKEARRRIHKGDYAHWTSNMITKNQSWLFVDDGKARELEQNYYITIRSGYLSLRQGDHFIIEPYSPHRFSRQFGYYQEVPGILRRDFRQADLDDGLRYWRICTLSKSMSKAWFPSVPPNAKKFSSDDYKKWWARVHGSYFDENLESLISMKLIAEGNGHEGGVSQSADDAVRDAQFIGTMESSQANKRKNASHHLKESSNADRHWKRPKKDSNTSESKVVDVDDNEAASNSLPTKIFAKELENEIFGMDDDGVSESSQESTAGPNSFTPIAKKGKKEVVNSPQIKDPAKCAEISVFEGEKLVLNHERNFLQILWTDLCRKISNTPVDSISSIHGDVQRVLASMKKFDQFDISHLEAMLTELFEKAAAYDNARSLSLDKAPRKLLAQKLSEAKNRLNEARARESKEVDQILLAKERLKKQQQNLQNIQTEIREIEEDIIAIENTPPLNDKAVEDLKTSAKQVEVFKGELENLKPFT